MRSGRYFTRNRRSVYDMIMSKTVEERFIMSAQICEDGQKFAKIGA